MVKSYILAAMISILPCSIYATSDVDNTPITLKSIDILLGKWYEIARIDHYFETGLDNVTAVYSVKADGKLTVTNAGWRDGKQKISNGKIKLTKASGLLRVSFFWPFYSDYRVLMMAEDNSCALIGGSSEKYLWILSRSPEMSQRDRNKLLREATKRGYKVSDLIWVDQKRNKKQFAK